MSAFDPLAAIGAALPADDLAGPAARPVGGQSTTVPFAELMSRGIEQVNGQLIASQVGLQHLAAGDVQNLHEVMIGLEQARLSFQLMMQVRGRLLEAYQDVMKMQV